MMPGSLVPYKEFTSKYVLEQYKNSPRLRGLINAVLTQCDDLEIALHEIFQALDLSSAVGPALDYLGSIVGVLRNPGEADATYRARIIAGRSLDGIPSPEAVRIVIKLLTGAPSVGLFPNWPAEMYYVLDGGTDAEVSVLEGESMTSGASLVRGTFLCGENYDDGYEFGYLVNEDNGKPLVVDYHELIYELITSDGDGIVDSENNLLTIKDAASIPEPEPPEVPTGSLQVSKVVSGSGFDPAKTFEIVVTFSEPVNYSVDGGEPLAEASDTYTAYLADSESVVLGNIPEDITYSVVESALSQQDQDAGYSVGTMTGGSGTIVADETQEATASNSYVLPTGSLEITESVSGTGFDPAKTFDVLVTFGEAINYSVDGGSPVSPASSTYTASLASGDSVVLGNIPAGTSFVVTEVALSQQDQDAGYSTGTVTGGTGTISKDTTSQVTTAHSYVAPIVDPLEAYEDRSIALSTSSDNSGRLQVPDSKNQSLFVVVPGVAGKVIRSFDVWTDQPSASSVYKTNEVVATTFDFDFLALDPTVAPGQKTSTPPTYASSWTTTQEQDGSYRQHIVLAEPITMVAGKQYGFIVTTRGDVDHTNCVCSGEVQAQNLMLTSTEWYTPSPQTDPPSIVFSWWEANKFCFAGSAAPSIKFYSTT